MPNDLLENILIWKQKVQGYLQSASIFNAFCGFVWCPLSIVIFLIAHYLKTVCLAPSNSCSSYLIPVSVCSSNIKIFSAVCFLYHLLSPLLRSICIPLRQYETILIILILFNLLHTRVTCYRKTPLSLLAVFLFIFRQITLLLWEDVALGLLFFQVTMACFSKAVGAWIWPFAFIHCARLRKVGTLCTPPYAFTACTGEILHV